MQCQIKWIQNHDRSRVDRYAVLVQCQIKWIQNKGLYLNRLKGVLVQCQIKWIQNYKHDYNGCTLVLVLFRYYCYSVSIKNVIVVLREEHVSKNFRKAARSAPFCHEKSKKALIP